MKKLSKNTKIILITLVLAILVGGYFQLKIKNDTSIDVSRVEEKISKILELSTARYDYVNVAIYKDSKKFNDIKLPFTTKKFMIKYSGYIKAGFDMENIEIESNEEKRIKLRVNKPLILDNVINEEEVYIYDEKSSIFNKLSYNDLYEVLIEEKENVKEDAISKGLLKEAETNAKELLNSLLETMGFEEVIISFK